MIRPLILGQLHPDLACAIALTFVEHPRVVVNLEGVTLQDNLGRALGTVHNWLTDDDPLDRATREYLAAKREASMTTVRRPGQPAWAAVSSIKTRDQAIRRARQAKDLARSLLAERGVLAHARREGLKLIGVD